MSRRPDPFLDGFLAAYLATRKFFVLMELNRLRQLEYGLGTKPKTRKKARNRPKAQCKGAK